MSLRVVQAALLLLSATLFVWPCLTDASPIVLADASPNALTDASPNALPDASPITPRDVSACKLPAFKDTYLSAGFGFPVDCVHSVGIVTAFMMFVDFPDAPHAETSGQETYDWLVPDAVDWLKYASYDRLRLEVRSDTRYYRMARPSTTWGGNDDILPHDRLYEYIREAIDAYMANGQAMPSADILYIVPTASAKTRRRSLTFPFSIKRTADKSTIAAGTIFFGSATLGPFGYLTLLHETGHALCLIDLYPMDSQDNRYVGGWDVMGLEVGPSPDLFAWDKWRLGWIDDRDVSCLSTTGFYRYVLRPLYRKMPGTKALVIAHDERTALVAEYRLDGGVDTATCSPGLLLYTVHTDIDTGYGPIRVIDANPTTNGCDNHALNDATLSINRTRVIRVHEFDVTIQIVSQSFEGITINVNRFGAD